MKPRWAAALSGLWGVVAGANSVVQMDLYGALSSARGPSFTFENINVMSLVGALKYIHTEHLAEHEVSPPERRTRKNGVDVITRARFQIRNPSSVVADPGYPETLVSNVDFGPFMNFERGKASSTSQLGLVQRHGDFVGVQDQKDQRFPAKDPYNWFSLSGWCPNQPSDMKPNHTWIKLDANRELCRGKNEAECAAVPGGKCLWQWSGDWLTSCNLQVDLAAQCANYTNTTGVLDKIRGGLCPGGAGSPSAAPTGEFGCSYTYGPVQEVLLDQLSGITNEDCGGRKCTDWADFRDRCTNESYRQKFVGGSSSETEAFGYCVEYDIVPACASSCSSKECLKIPEGQREVGLPFWRGRCSSQANQARAEKLAEAFGISGARTGHQLIDSDLLKTPVSCVNKVPGSCAPAPGQGGMYCSREWAGLCQPCYIPGTVEAYGAAKYTPTCPYNILSNPDYRGRFALPTCASLKPRDLCCLYIGTCASVTKDAALVPLDDDGYALVASTMNTTAMAAFLGRAAKAQGLARSPASLDSFAYGEWGRSPAAGRGLAAALRDMTARGLVMSSSTTTAAGPRSNTTTTTPLTFVVVSDGGTTTAVEAGGSLPFWGWALIAAGLVAVGGAVTMAACTISKRKKRVKRAAKVDMFEAAVRNLEFQRGSHAAPAAAAPPMLTTLSAPMATYTAAPQAAGAMYVVPPRVTSVVAAPAASQAYSPALSAPRGTYVVSPAQIVPNPMVASYRAA